MITTVPPGGKILTQVPRKIMSLQDIEVVLQILKRNAHGLTFYELEIDSCLNTKLGYTEILHNILLNLTIPHPS